MTCLMVEVIAVFQAAEVEAQVRCTPCKIRSEVVAVLGTEDDYPGSFGYWPKYIARDILGNFITVMPGFVNDQVPWVFNRRGRFVKELGRIGSGPGEFRLPHAVLKGNGDSLHIFDSRLGRHSVLSPQGTYVRSTPSPTQLFSIALLPDGHWIANASVVDAGRIGHPLHLLDADGRYITHFDLEESINPRRPLTWQRQIAVAIDGTIWTMPRAHEYRIEHWDRRGKVIKTYRPRRPWYPSYADAAAPSHTVPPTPSIEGLWYDRTHHHLWVFGLVHDRNWQRGLGRTIKSSDHGGLERTPIENLRKTYDAVIDVFDLQTERLIASQRFDMPLTIVIDDGYVGSPQHGADGAQIVEVYRLTLSR